MRYLLFPEEERALVSQLVNELGLRLLATSPGEERDTDLRELIANDFPVLMSSEMHKFYFWCSAIGPIRGLVTLLHRKMQENE
jgi:hypothetical protein